MYVGRGHPAVITPLVDCDSIDEAMLMLAWEAVVVYYLLCSHVIVTRPNQMERDKRDNTYQQTMPSFDDSA